MEESIEGKRTYLLLFLIVMLAIALRLLYFNPGVNYPAANLALEAFHVTQGIYDPNIIWHPMGIRYTLVLLVSLSFTLFGVSKLSLFLPNLLFSIATVVLLYFLGKELMNHKIGLISAFLYAIFPLDVFDATVMNADIIMAFFVTLAFFLYYKSIKITNTKQSFILLFVSGSVLSLALFTKIFALLAFPVLLIYELCFEKNLKKSFIRFSPIILGFLTVASPFVLYQYLQTGDILYNYHVEKEHIYAITNIQNNLQPSLKFIPEELDLLRFPTFMFNPLFNYSFDKRPNDGENSMLNIYFFLAIFAVIYYRKKLILEKHIARLFLWFIIPFTFIEGYYYLQKVQSYLIIAMIPLVLFISCFIYDFISSKHIHPTRKKILFLILSLILLFISFVQLGRFTVFNPLMTYEGHSGADQEEFLALILEKQNVMADVYVPHYALLPSIMFYTKYQFNGSLPYSYRGARPYTVYDLHFVNNFSDIHKAYVLIDMRYMDNPEDVFGFYGGASIHLIQWIPNTWQSIQSYASGEITYAELFYAP